MSSAANKLFKSSGLMMLAKFVQRLIGLVSIIILARVLDPFDFSIVAISLLVIHFCETLTATGSGAYLISKDTIDDEDAYSAWTLDFILKGTVWALLFLSIPYLAQFYDIDGLEPVLYVATSILLINSLVSPGVHLLKRELEYKKIFILTICQKFISFSVVMTIVLIEPSYWALVIGDIASSATMAIGSYFIHPIRPKFSLKRTKEQLPFSKWIISRASVGYSKSQMDTFLVAKFFSSQDIGVFHLTRNLARMPNEVLAPAIAPIVASLSRVKYDLDAFSRQLSLCLVAVLLITTPLAVFMAIFPEDIILFFFGDKWSAAYAILPPLAVVMFTVSINEVLNQTCVAQKMVKHMFVFELCSLVVVLTTLLTFRNSPLVEFTYARAATALALLTGFFIYIAKKTRLSTKKILLLFLPIITASLAAGKLTDFIATTHFTFPIIVLIIKSVIFFSLFYLLVAVFYLIWYKNTYEGAYIKGLHHTSIKRIAEKFNLQKK